MTDGAAIEVELRVRLVHDEQRAVPGARLAKSAQEAGLGQHRAAVGQHTLDQHRGRPPLPQYPFGRLEVVEVDNRLVRGRGRADSQLLGHQPGAVARPQRLVKLAVVLAREHQDALAPGCDAGHPERLGVGRGGGYRELPLRQAEAQSELFAHAHGRLGGQEQLHAPCGLGADSLGQPGVGVAEYGRHVAHVEVDIAVAVDVGEVCSAAAGDP